MNLARPFYFPGLLALALVLLPLAAVAEGQAAPSFGEEVEVVGVRPRTAAADPTAAATVVEASRFAGETKSVAELVATAPGVAVNQYGGLGQLATVSIRGSTGEQVPVFLDGLPLYTAAGGGVDLSRIPRAWIERIEVVRGAEGATFGAGALGGVLNIITRTPSRPQWSLEASGGSFGSGSAAAEIGAGSDAAHGLALLSIDGWQGRYPYDFDPTPNVPGGSLSVNRTNNAWLTGGGLAKGTLRAGGGDLDAALQLSAGRREIPGNAFNLTASDSQCDRRAGAVVRYLRPLGDALELSLQARVGEDELDLDVPSNGIATRQRDLGGGALARLVGSVSGHALTAEVDGSGERLASEGTGTRSRATFAAMLADDFWWAGRVRLAPAIRLERVGPFEGWSAKLGATSHLAGPVSARASVGRSFRPPSFAELYLQQAFVTPNPSLAPEQGWSADTALSVESGPATATVGAFYTRYSDVIVYLPASFQRVKPFNVGQADGRGAEAELALAPIGRLRLSAQLAYTFLFTQTLSGSPAGEGFEVPHRARHRGFARVAIAPGPVDAHVEAQYVGPQWQDQRNLISTPATFLLGAGASVRVLRRPEVHLQLEVRNLLDDRALTDGFYNPLPGRMVTVTVRVSGGKDDAP